MTTFLESEDQAKSFAIENIKDLTNEVFKQKPKKMTIGQFGFEMEGDGYPFTSGIKELAVVLIKTERGWNVWIESDGICFRL